jgi:hypothetical protein
MKRLQFYDDTFTEGLCSVAKGPKFRLQISKGALQKCLRPEKLAAEFFLNMPKKAELF